MKARTTFTLMPLLLVACSGQVGDAHQGSATSVDPPATGGGAGSASPTGGAGGGGGAGAGAAGQGDPGGPPLDCKAPQAAALRARLLSPSQYNHTVLDLLKVAGDHAANFGAAVFAQLDDLAVEHRANAAAEIALEAATNLAKWSPCVPPAVAAAACEQQIIDNVGASAFRHPLTPADAAQLKTLFDAGVKEKDFATGVEWFLTGVLQSPDFLYQLARPAPAERVGEVRPLAPYEYASRLSYFVWDSMPDDKLFAAAAADELADPTKVRAQLTRMMQDARFMRGVEGFYSTWLRLGAFHEVARDATGFNDSVVTSLATSLLMSATQLYATATPNVSRLFSGQTYYMNDVLRTFYGVAGSGTAFAPVAMGGEERRGIVTHPGLMALFARPKESFPIARGLFVRRILMCQEIPPPPAGLEIPELPPIAEGLTTRDRLNQHVKAACASCHDMIDPPGFALENFDEVGRHRTVDHGKPVDTSGLMEPGTDLAGPFTNGDAFLAKLAESADVKRCFAQQYLQYALAREAQPEEACSVDALGKSFAPSGDLKELVVSVVTSDAFRLRLAEGVVK